MQLGCHVCEGAIGVCERQALVWLYATCKSEVEFCFCTTSVLIHGTCIVHDSVRICCRELVAIKHRPKQQESNLSVRIGSLSSNNCWAEQPISRTSLTACQASRDRLPVEACIASGVRLLPWDSTTSLTASMTKLSAVLLDSQQLRNVKAARICPVQVCKYVARCKHRSVTCI